MENGTMTRKDVETIESSRVLVAESMSAGVLSDKHIQARVNMIQGAIKNIFKKEVHYGVIPGTQKPTLYKPGAEQLLVMFRIAPAAPVVEDLSTSDSIRYRVTRSGNSQSDGRFLGAGTGECSSDEEKYKWRRPVCNQEYDECPPDRRREVWKKYQGQATKMKQIRTAPADVANTILKMADKRALVAMTLMVTGASDAFNQDIEDLPEELRESVLGEEKVSVPMPSRVAPGVVAPAPAPTPTPEPQSPVEAIVLIADVKRFADGHFEVVDAEGVVYATTDEGVAKAAKDGKGFSRRVHFQPVDGKAPVLLFVTIPAPAVKA